MIPGLAHLGGEDGLWTAMCEQMSYEVSDRVWHIHSHLSPQLRNLARAVELEARRES